MTNVSHAFALNTHTTGWRSHYDTVTGKLFVGDVGGNDQNMAVEEINVVVGGANYGWPLCEGHCDNPTYASTCDCSKHVGGFHTYAHSEIDAAGEVNAAIVLGFVYRGTQFPNLFHGAIFFGDYSRQWIKYLPLDSRGEVREG